MDMAAKQWVVSAVNLMLRYQELSLHLPACQHRDDGFRFHTSKEQVKCLVQ
jgi:hypothetical protein